MREKTSVTRIEEQTVWLGDERIEAGTIIWAAGVAASPLGRSLGVPLDRAGRVAVGKDLTLPGHPEVFVIGDMAVLADDAGHQLPGVAQVAMQQAARAAANIRATIAGTPMRPFHYRNYGNMATIGRNAAIADLGWLRVSGFLAWGMWLVIHIFWLIGFRNRALVLIQWASAYVTYQRSVRLITGTTGTLTSAD